MPQRVQGRIVTPSGGPRSFYFIALGRTSCARCGASNAPLFPHPVGYAPPCIRAQLYARVLTRAPLPNFFIFFKLQAKSRTTATTTTTQTHSCVSAAIPPTTTPAMKQAAEQPRDSEANPAKRPTRGSGSIPRRRPRHRRSKRARLNPRAPFPLPPPRETTS